MAKLIYFYGLLLLITSTYATNGQYGQGFDDIDLELQNGAMGKLLRAMENQTKADTLNLPANASSIRENITDTFSCDNRTYGYYADVDNDCQLFHVCLPTQTASGRSIMYRWSFICPNETIFNQEVLVCTRPRDSINCEDSPMYYDLNMEIGKESNDTKSDSNDKENANAENKVTENTIEENKDPMKERVKVQRRKPTKKQNLIVESLLREVVKDESEDLKHRNVEILNLNPEVAVEPRIEAVNEGIPVVVTEEDENSRIFSERSVMRRNRKLKRGALKFKADV